MQVLDISSAVMQLIVPLFFFLIKFLLALDIHYCIWLNQLQHIIIWNWFLINIKTQKHPIEGKTKFLETTKKSFSSQIKLDKIGSQDVKNYLISISEEHV